MFPRELRELMFSRNLQHCDTKGFKRRRPLLMKKQVTRLKQPEQQRNKMKYASLCSTAVSNIIFVIIYHSWWISGACVKHKTFFIVDYRRIVFRGMQRDIMMAFRTIRESGSVADIAVDKVQPDNHNYNMRVSCVMNSSSGKASFSYTIRITRHHKAKILLCK